MRWTQVLDAYQDSLRLDHHPLRCALKIHRSARRAIGPLIRNDRKCRCLVLALGDRFGKPKLLRLDLILKLLDPGRIIRLELRGFLHILELLQTSLGFQKILLKPLDMVLGTGQFAPPQFDLLADLLTPSLKLLGDRDQVIRSLLGLLDRFGQLALHLVPSRGSRVGHIDHQEQNQRADHTQQYRQEWKGRRCIIVSTPRSFAHPAFLIVGESSFKTTASLAPSASSPMGLPCEIPSSKIPPAKTPSAEIPSAWGSELLA